MKFSQLRSVPLEQDALDAVYTPSGEVLLATTAGKVAVVDPKTGTIRRTFGKHPSSVRAIALSPDASTVATVTAEDATVRLWNLATGAPSGELTAGTGFNDVTFTPDGGAVAAANTDTTVNLWPLDPD